MSFQFALASRHITITTKTTTTTTTTTRYDATTESRHVHFFVVSYSAS